MDPELKIKELSLINLGLGSVSSQATEHRMLAERKVKLLSPKSRLAASAKIVT
jgi:hypothetical protein